MKQTNAQKARKRLGWPAKIGIWLGIALIAYLAFGVFWQKAYPPIKAYVAENFFGQTCFHYVGWIRLVCEAPASDAGQPCQYDSQCEKGLCLYEVDQKFEETTFEDQKVYFPVTFPKNPEQGGQCPTFEVETYGSPYCHRPDPSAPPTCVNEVM